MYETSHTMSSGRWHDGSSDDLPDLTSEDLARRAQAKIDLASGRLAEVALEILADIAAGRRYLPHGLLVPHPWYRDVKTTAEDWDFGAPLPATVDPRNGGFASVRVPCAWARNNPWEETHAVRGEMHIQVYDAVGRVDVGGSLTWDAQAVAS